MDAMDSPVWRLHGLVASEPGWMAFDNGTVVLMLEDDEGSAVEAFAVPVSEIKDVKYPRAQMSAGCNFVVDGEKYKISFLQPQNTRMPGPYGAVQGAASIPAGRKSGKAWKAILT